MPAAKPWEPGGVNRNELPATLQNIQRCQRYLQLGLFIIVVAWGLTAINGTAIPSSPSLKAITQALPFVGMGSLLLGIGTHLHLLHLNILRMAAMQGASQSMDK